MVTAIQNIEIQQIGLNKNDINAPTAKLASVSFANNEDIGPGCAFFGSGPALDYAAKCKRHEFIIDSGCNTLYV